MMKKFVKIIFISICMILSFSISKVVALNNTSLEYIKDVYYNMQIGSYYHSDYQAYLKVDGVVVYCVEPEVLVGINKDYNLIPSSSANLTVDQLKQIELIGHYGYGYMEHTNYKYYLAAQELMWEIIRPNIQLSWSSLKDGVGNSYISVEKEKNEIKNLIALHDVVPYFSNSYVETTLGETIEFTDTILKYYEIVDSGKHNVRIEGSKLIINVDKEYVGESTIKLRKKNRSDNLETKIFHLNDFQTLIYPRNKDVIEATFKINTKVGTITIKKVDSETLLENGQGEASLQGTIYHIYDNNDNMITTLELNGKSETTKSLKLGTYKVKEFKSGVGYILDETVYEITLSKDNLNPILILKNDVIKNIIKIKKLYGDIDFYDEENAEFILFDVNNNETIYITNKEGEISFSLPYGKYRLKQIKGKDYYQYVDDIEIIVDEKSSIIQEFELKNYEIKASLIISKIDFVTKEKITETVGFKIYNLDKDEYIDNGNIFYTLDGILKIDNLSLGNYRIEEVIVPKGYLKGKDIEILFENDLEIKIENEMIYNVIRINKIGVTNENEEVLLNDVVFGIYAKEDIIINNKTYYLKDELIDTVATKNGVATSKKLPYGFYYIKELYTNSNYVLDEKIYEFTINKENMVELTIKNIEKPILKFEEIIVPDTGLKRIELNGLTAIIIVGLCYLIIKYAKK